ncbi:MAG: hypothetical protein ACLTDR_10140 [Adlercreutzia equolifaciens]
MKVIVRDSLPIADAGCALCGQCITHCPTGALTARDDVSRIMDAILTRPWRPWCRWPWRACRLGEGVELPATEATPGRLAAARTPWASTRCSTLTSPPISPSWKRAASSWNSSALMRPAPCSRAAALAGHAS